MDTQEIINARKENSVKALQNLDAQRTERQQKRGSFESTLTQLVNGETITFKVAENGCAGDLFTRETAKGYECVTDDKGRKILTSTLFGRPFNGLDYNESTADKRRMQFVEDLDNVGELSFIVANISVLPATNPKYGNFLTYTFERK